MFVYDAFDKLVAEYSVNDSTNQSPKVNYLTTDLLETPRVITDENRQIQSRRDLTPFGEEIPVGLGGRSAGQQYGVVDGVRQKFTGQHRDEAAKLDYFNARHYSYSAGRFMSADSFGGKISSPQTLNLYAYALNNPLKWVDPTGHFPEGSGDYCQNCHLDDNNYLIQENGAAWRLGHETVNAGPCDCSEGDRIHRPPPLPTLRPSWQDRVPVWNNIRGLAFNINCHGGGCNIDRATGHFIGLAVDLSPVGMAGRSFALARTAITEEILGGGESLGQGFLRTSAEEAVESEASNANAGRALNSKLGELESAQTNAADTRTLPDGRIRYSRTEVPARTQGPSRGAAHVTEYNPRTGNVRSWSETRGHAGEILRVHPKSVNGGQIKNGPYYPR